MASGSCVPHQQAEHMTAPTRSRTTSMKTLANGEPSTHDPIRTSAVLRGNTLESVFNPNVARNLVITDGRDRGADFNPVLRVKPSRRVCGFESKTQMIPG